MKVLQSRSAEAAERLFPADLPWTSIPPGQMKALNESTDALVRMVLLAAGLTLSVFAAIVLIALSAPVSAEATGSSLAPSAASAASIDKSKSARDSTSVAAIAAPVWVENAQTTQAPVRRPAQQSSLRDVAVAGRGAQP